MTAAEERRAFAGGKTGAEKNAPLLPGRLRALLWLLCVNGALLGVEAVAQRAAGSCKLLFLVQPRLFPNAATQFGPYAYRSNAAQYFDLLWPLCLGFWLTLQRGGGRGWSRHGLLVGAGIMAACPVISSSRAGALVAMAMLLAALIYLAPGSRGGGRRAENGGRQPGTAAWLVLFLAVTIALGWHFGWAALSKRLEVIGEGYAGREAMYEAARPMAQDYPWFGTGPGTFGTVFQLYRISNATFWPAQLHNDWLETRITFGRLGLGLLLAALALVGVRWFVPGGVRGHRRLATLAWLALAGCLTQARFDFPFQVHSTLLLFLVICAILLNLSRTTGAERR
jgi:O-antigen ligase